MRKITVRHSAGTAAGTDKERFVALLAAGVERYLRSNSPRKPDIDESVDLLAKQSGSTDGRMAGGTS